MPFFGGGVVNWCRHLSLLGEARSGSPVSIVLHLIGLRWGSLNELESTFLTRLASKGAGSIWLASAPVLGI